MLSSKEISPMLLPAQRAPAADPLILLRED